MALSVPPIQFVPDEDADANEVNSNFNAIASKFNYAIEDADISLDADIDGHKLSTTPAKQVPVDALGNNSVSDRVLASSAISDAARAVGTDHIKSGAVTAAKLATGLGLIQKGTVTASVNLSTYDPFHVVPSVTITDFVPNLHQTPSAFVIQALVTVTAAGLFPQEVDVPATFTPSPITPAQGACVGLVLVSSSWVQGTGILTLTATLYYVVLA